MKKYLFDKIVFDNSQVKFYLYRDPTFLEVFTTNSCGKAEKDSDGSLFIRPNNFVEFLQCLKRTKIKDKDYQISYFDVMIGQEKESSFDDLLKKFIKNVYFDKPASKKQIEKFCKKAFEIRKTSMLSAEVLNKLPEEHIK